MFVFALLSRSSSNQPQILLQMIRLEFNIITIILIRKKMKLEKIKQTESFAIRNTKTTKNDKNDHKLI